MTIEYGERDEKARPVYRIAMPRPRRLYAPGGTMHVVARCNNREFYFIEPEDYKIILDHLGEMSSVYEIKLFAYALMSNIFTCSSNLLLGICSAARCGGS
jgi:hypothetical protein